MESPHDIDSILKMLRSCKESMQNLEKKVKPISLKFRIEKKLNFLEYYCMVWCICVDNLCVTSRLSMFSVKFKIKVIMTPLLPKPLLPKPPFTFQSSNLDQYNPLMTLPTMKLWMLPLLSSQTSLNLRYSKCYFN